MHKLSAVLETDEPLSTSRRTSKIKGLADILSNSPKKPQKINQNKDEKAHQLPSPRKNEAKSESINSALLHPKKTISFASNKESSINIRQHQQEVKGSDVLKQSNDPYNYAQIPVPKLSFKAPSYQKNVDSPNLRNTKRKGTESKSNVDINNIDSKTQLEATNDDWISSGMIGDVDEEKDKVKKLDAWRFEMMAEKLSGNKTTNNNLRSQYKNESISQDEDPSSPRVNVKLIHSILSSPDEEKKFNNKKGLLPSLVTEPLEESRKVEGESEKGYGVQSLANAIRESNQELLFELISRKIKDYFTKVDIHDMTGEQLKLHTKTIAESVIEPFKGLKQSANITMIQNRIDNIIKKLNTNKEAQQEEMMEDSSQMRSQAKPVVEYQLIESNMIKSLNNTLQNIKNLQENIKDLNKESLKINSQLKNYFKQLEILTAIGDTRKTLSEIDETPKRKEKNNKNVETQLDVSDHVVKTFGGMEYCQFQMSRQERRKRKLEIEHKIKGLQDQLSMITQKINLNKKEIEGARNYKTSYKIQLKDLYLKILKDETTLVNENNNLNYIWVVRSLIKMDGEVKNMAFPGFLDQTSINFALNAAKTQEDLENHCRENGLMFLIAESEEFKDTINLWGSNKNDNNQDKIMSTLHYNSNLVGDVSLLQNDMAEKNFHVLLDKFKTKLSALKKSNLKAKKLTNYTYYNSKGKYSLSKWEDVDPNNLQNPFAAEGYDIQNRNLEKFPKFDLNAVRSLKNPMELALEMIENFKKAKKEEMVRLIKQSAAKDFDEKQMNLTKKIFRFLFCRKGGEKGFQEWLKEKSIHHQRTVKQPNNHYQKSSEYNQKNSSTFYNLTSQSNQFRMSPKLEEMSSPHDIVLKSPSKLNLSVKLDPIDKNETTSSKLNGLKVLGSNLP